MANSNPLPIGTLAAQLGISEQFVEPYGKYKAKLNLDLLKACPQRSLGKYILVSAVTPTPLGEGKTTTTIGLGMALAKLGQKSVITLRQSSLGPTFGVKGGGAGGGKAQIVPLEESILHLTGDMHAVTQAHNQIAAMVDNSYFHGNPLNIDPDRIQIRRVMDVNDRFLRNITVGRGGEQDGIPHDSGFDISSSSELMAILALVSGESQAEVLRDLRARIGRMVVAFSRTGKPITAEDIKAAGAATVLLKEAIQPTLMQTAENTPVLIHAGPFANIAHGCSSVVADQLALHLADYVVTEAGFAADMGAEKFFDIKCRVSGLKPAAAVLVTTLRALKAHTGKHKIVPGHALPPDLLAENPDEIEIGSANLKKQIENLKAFGVPVVVAINAFPEDHESEIAVVRRVASEAGAWGTAVSSVYAQGGAGGVELAQLVMTAAMQESHFEFLYPLSMSIKEKIKTIATRIYGAADVSYSPTAEAQIASFEQNGFGELPICMAKTHLSLSHDSKLKGAPSGYVFPVREVRASVGAGFIYPLAGTMTTMPGLGSHPNAENIDIDAKGNVVGLF